jgi:hypothetical protein
MGRRKGTPVSEEHAAKIAASQRNRYARERELRNLGQELLTAAESGDSLAQAALERIRPEKQAS